MLVLWTFLINKLSYLISDKRTGCKGGKWKDLLVRHRKILECYPSLRIYSWHCQNILRCDLSALLPYKINKVLTFPLASRSYSRRKSHFKWSCQMLHWVSLSVKVAGMFHHRSSQMHWSETGKKKLDVCCKYWLSL